MATDLHQARSVSHLVEHLRQKAPVSDYDAVSIGGEIANALLRFKDTWDADAERERARLEWIVDGLDTALAGLLSSLIETHGLSLPFERMADIWAWLHFAEGEELQTQQQVMSEVSDWRVKSLWRVRESAVEEVTHLDDLNEEVLKTRGSYVETRSRLAPAVQHLIEDLCRTWYSRVGELGLTNDANPSTPLLRFLDACLEAAMGSERPDKGEVRNFVRPYLKPVFAKSSREAPAADRNGMAFSHQENAIRFHGD